VAHGPLDFPYLVVLALIGATGGLVSGVLGIGGGIILAPLLLYVPPVCGLAPIDMKLVSGLTMVQSCVSSLSAAVVHRRFKRLHPALIACQGMPIAFASLAGAWLSAAVDSRVLLVLFALMALLAAAMMFAPNAMADVDVKLEDLRFNRGRAVAGAVGLGTLGGLVGQTGSFLLIPVMIQLLSIPTRIAIGSSLAIVLCAAIPGTVGKALAGQIDLRLAAPLIPGALLGAYLGGHLSRRLPAHKLRYGVGVASALAAARVLYALR
jgi:uncharacterized protein